MTHRWAFYIMDIQKIKFGLKKKKESWHLTSDNDLLLLCINNEDSKTVYIYIIY